VGNARRFQITGHRIVGLSLVVMLVLVLVLFGLKWLEVRCESTPTSQSLAILGQSLQRRFDDLLLWSYFIVLCLGTSVFAALRLPDVRLAPRPSLWLGGLWLCLVIFQFVTYFWSQSNPSDPGTFFWVGQPGQSNHATIAGIQRAEGCVDLLLIVAMQTVIVMSLRVCGLARDARLADKTRLGLALFIALGLMGGVALATAYAKLYGSTLSSHERSSPEVLTGVITLRIWPLAIVGLVLTYSVLTELPSQLADMLRAHVTK
jgi:hypothetical protein